MTAAPTERMFLAVALDDETRHTLAAHLDPHLGGGAAPGKVVPIGNWHVTLRFLGATAPLERDLVLGHLAEHDLPDAFPISFGGLGAFPRPGRAGVLWLGVDSAGDELSILAAAAEEAAQAAGFGAEDRPFHAHLTLSRIRPPRNVATLVEKVPPVGAAAAVEAVTLYRSRLGGGPARYEIVDQVPLG